MTHFACVLFDFRINITRTQYTTNGIYLLINAKKNFYFTVTFVINNLPYRFSRKTWVFYKLQMALKSQEPLLKDIVFFCSLFSTENL